MFRQTLAPANGHRLPGGFFGISPLAREFDTLFKDWDDFSAVGSGPKVNVFEDDKAVYLEAEVPGFGEEELDLSFSQGVLTLKGHHDEAEGSDENDESQVTRHRQEFRTMDFERHFRLAREFDEANFAAEFKNGLLKVTMPKKVPEPDPVTKIKIGQ